MKVLLIAVSLLMVLATISFAGPNQNAKVAVHVMSHNAKRSCTTSFPAITECQDIVYTVQASDVDCFPVFFNLVEFKGCEYGLDWPGTYSCTFTSCSDFTIGDIVDAGDGISRAWTECQSTDIAVPGWAWLHEPDSAMVCVVSHPITFEINVLDCNETLDEPEETFCAGIAGAEGEDPCDYPTATEESTWGSIKGLFR